MHQLILCWDRVSTDKSEEECFTWKEGHPAGSANWFNGSAHVVLIDIATGQGHFCDEEKNLFLRLDEGIKWKLA